MANATHFLALLQGGAKPHFVAKSFASALVQESNEADIISWDAAANFIKNCFDAINFKLPISEHDALSQFQNYVWPIEEIKRYTFEYDKDSFKLVEKFLFKLCQRINTLTEEEPHVQSTISSTERLPIYYFMQLIALWNRACTQLRKQYNTKFFNEPLSRIDFQLLRGFQSLRQNYRFDFPVLDNICDRLIDSVLLGVLYPETHKIMIPEITKMLHEDFHLFDKHLNKPDNFYETILTANLSAAFHNDILKSLSQLIDTYCLNFDELTTDDLQRQKSLDVSNFLIRRYMLEAYYHYLTKENNKFVLTSLLHFLLSLQNKLVALDCFLDAFMEAVLLLVLDGNDQIGDLAAKFYITVQNRRLDDDNVICINCMLFYFTKRNSAAELLIYIRRLWKYMSLEISMDIFFERLNCNERENEKFRVWTAHIFCAFIQYMLEDYAKNRLKIFDLLEKIIESLQSMKCLITQSILLNIFDALDKMEIPNKETELREVFLFLGHCVEEKIWSDEDWQNPLLKKWFLHYKSAAKYTEDPKIIEEVGFAIADHCLGYIEEMEAYNESLNADQAQKYSCAVQKLCLLMQSGLYKLEPDVPILDVLRKNLLIQNESPENKNFHKYADRFNMLIDAYALELYVVGLVQAFNEQDSVICDGIKEKVKELESFLQDWLRNTEIKTQPIVRIKTYFNCLLGLYFAFASNLRNNVLSLTTSFYDMMVRTLLHTLFKATGRKASFDEFVENTEMHPLRALSYENSMINYFTELHSMTYVEINDHNIWQICLYYPTAAKFKNVLHDLLLTLAQKRFNIYKRVVPIVIYNLHKQHPPWSENCIVKAIKAHKSFIDNLGIEDRSLFSCHVVYEVIELISKSLNVRESRLSSDDRLSPLKHLNIFLKNLDLSAEITHELRGVVSNLRRSSLRLNERRTLTGFLDTFKEDGAVNASMPGSPRQ